MIGVVAVLVVGAVTAFSYAAPATAAPRARAPLFAGTTPVGFVEIAETGTG